MTADALRDRIAEALVDAAHDQYPEGMRPGDNEDCGCPWGIGEIDWLGFADAVLAVLADADPTDIGGRTLAKIQMLEQERDAMQRRTFELAEQIAAARAELPEVLDLLRAVVERCVPAVLDAQTRPTDDLWRHVWRRLGTARPRTKETTND